MWEMKSKIITLVWVMSIFLWELGRLCSDIASPSVCYPWWMLACHATCLVLSHKTIFPPISDDLFSQVFTMSYNFLQPNLKCHVLFFVSSLQYNGDEWNLVWLKKVKKFVKTLRQFPFIWLFSERAAVY